MKALIRFWSSLRGLKRFLLFLCLVFFSLSFLGFPCFSVRSPTCGHAHGASRLPIVLSGSALTPGTSTGTLWLPMGVTRGGGLLHEWRLDLHSRSVVPGFNAGFFGEIARGARFLLRPPTSEEGQYKGTRESKLSRLGESRNKG